MPAVLPLELEPVLKSGRYRHMMKRDVAVWERFLDKYGGAFLGVFYDAAFGGSQDLPDTVPEADRRGWQYTTALKVDAILIGPRAALIVEVRPWATVSALGAALAYTLVADRDHFTDLPLQPTIVCEGIQVDVKWCADRMGVLVYVV